MVHQHLLVLAVVCSLFINRTATAQIIVSTPVPHFIKIPSLDSVIAKAKHQAMKTGEPKLEFEMVKLQIKQIVDANRANNGQEVSFGSPGAVKAWLRSVANRTNQSYDSLVTELAEAVSPNPLPDLTGDSIADSDYLENRALENLRKAGSQNSDENAPVLDQQIALTPTPAAPSQTPAIEYSGPAGDPRLIRIQFEPTTATLKRKRR